ncbi:MAG: DUF2662 domain-containing protein [Firmicutes bacterium HGW-Firmicutes-14]|nr:MAG: DUF2662 domain-containing protein [Firmicutes bacterium HGW-Firmicutes-14]
MGFFTKLEKLSEKYIEGFFKNKFADSAQPAEIAALLLREMRDRKTVSISKVYVPNEYTVFLGEEDWPSIEPVSQSLAAELQEFIKQRISDKDYEITGEVKVFFELNKDLGLGIINVKGSFSQELPKETEKGKSPAEKPSEYTLIADRGRFYHNDAVPPNQDTLTRAGVPPLPKAILIRKTGTGEDKRFPLGTQGVIIGRRRSSDISLEDTNISRVHASIDYMNGEYYISDLGSTNGTFVNGARISKKKLAEGDLIRMGITILEFRVV